MPVQYDEMLMRTDPGWSVAHGAQSTKANAPILIPSPVLAASNLARSARFISD
jgi:hypothetical protein